MKNISHFFCGLLVAALVLSAGCSTAARPSGMKVAKLSLDKTSSKSIAVKTGGGRPTNPAWTSQIEDKDLAQAIVESLKASGLFKTVVSSGEGDFVLGATIINLNQPIFGFTMSVGTEILWSVTPKGQTKPCWEKSIVSSATKGVGDAFSGATRVRITTEAAVQENIRQALTQLSKSSCLQE